MYGIGHLIALVIMLAFIPLMVWPIIYLTFAVVGLILFHLVYAAFALARMRRRRRSLPAA